MSNVTFPSCDACTVLSSPVTVDQLTIQVNNVAGWPNLTLPENIGKRFLIGLRRSFDNQVEYVWVVATNGSTWTVERNPSQCRDTLGFARNDLVFNPIGEPLALVLECFQ